MLHALHIRVLIFEYVTASYQSLYVTLGIPTDENNKSVFFTIVKKLHSPGVIKSLSQSVLISRNTQNYNI